MSGPERPTDEARAEAEIRCAKCGHRNQRRSNVCESCGAHLHVVCHRCGHRNERSRSKCTECGQKLHRSWLTRASRGILGKNRKLTLLQVILLLIGILVGFAVIYYFSNFKPQEPEGHYAPLLPTQLTGHA
jgi:uncharacterized membrane protein YvbJ